MLFFKNLRLLLLVLLLQCLCGLAVAAPNPKPSAAPAKTYTTVIPFDYDPVLMPYIVVQASINGQPPLPFIVDTGAAHHYLDIEPWAAKTLGLPALRLSKSQFVKGQGQKTVTCTLVKSLKVVGLGQNNDFTINFNNEFYDTKAGQQSDTPFQIVSILSWFSNSFRGAQPAGIISLDTIQLPKMKWQIDFQHKNLILIQQKKAWMPSPGSVAVPLRQDASSGLYYITAALAPNISLDFAIDTGSPTTNVQNLDALPLPNAQWAQGIYPAPDRYHWYDTVLLPHLQLAGLAEPNVPLYTTSAANATGSANLIGLNFLSRFLVTFDPTANKMYLARRTDYMQQIVPRGQVEVRLEKRGAQYDAAWVNPSSPAVLAGLHTGDQIERVDGKSLQAVPQYAAQNLLDGFEGTTARLTLLTTTGKESEISFTRSKWFSRRRHALIGVSLDWFQGNLLVSGVTPGSPLDHFLKWNNDLYSINGEPVAKMTMDEAFQKLDRPDLVLQVWSYEDKTWQEVHIAALPAQTQVIAGPVPAVNRYAFDSKTGWTLVSKQVLGLSLEWVDGHLMVASATLGSSLAPFLKWNDEITAINAQPVGAMTMTQAFHQMQRPDLDLQVWRGSGKSWQELHIAPLSAQTQVIAGPVPAVSTYVFDAKTGWTVVPN
jgi:hypothetical protein